MKCHMTLNVIFSVVDTPSSANQVKKPHNFDRTLGSKIRIVQGLCHH
jgi:hypothetical protein